MLDKRGNIIYAIAPWANIKFCLRLLAREEGKDMIKKLRIDGLNPCVTCVWVTSGGACVLPDDMPCSFKEEIKGMNAAQRYVSPELMPPGAENSEDEATHHSLNVAKDPVNNVVTHWASGNVLTFDPDCPYCQIVDDLKRSVKP